jgi:glycosyltransferase involved in cell wall biosynthesis
MKIIQISPYYPPHVGGTEQRVRDLSEKLAKKGHQIEVFTSDIGCPKGKQLKSKKNLKIHYLKSLEFAHTPITPSLFWKLMRIPKDSIIHIHVAQSLMPEIVWLFSKIRKIPYVAHIRIDAQPTGFFGFLLNPYKKIFLKKVLRDANKIIVLTEDYGYLIKDKYGINKDKIKIIPNWNNFNIIKNKSMNLHNPIRLLFVGRLSYQKNIPILLDSFKEAYTKNKKIELHIVGEGEDKKLIEKFIKEKKLKNKIIIYGSKTGNELEKIYKKSDIFISLTRQESFGTVYLEAMASGLPIITTNIFAVRNVVKNNYNGILVKPTPEKIAKAIERLVQNTKLREKLIKNGLKEVKKYSLDKIFSKFESTYMEVIYDTKKK